EYSRALVLGDDLICAAGKKKDLLLSRPATSTVVETVDRKGAKMLKTQWKLGSSETLETPTVTAVLRAGNRIYAGSENRLAAFQIATKTKEAWRVEVDGTPASLLAADDRLFVVTREGRILCYGADAEAARSHPWKPTAPAKARQRSPGAYAVHFGFESSEALAEKVERSDLRIIAFDSRPEKVERARRELAAAGLYGDRIAVHVGNPTSVD